MKKIFLFIFLLAGSWLAAQAPQSAKIQPIHEAFVIRATDPLPQEVVATQPPAPIAESRPPQANPLAIWIPGYWMWIRERQNYEWVCGVWRVPPADHVWSTGYWKGVTGGWTWVKGAWMPDPAKTQAAWVYSQKPPPAPQNEVTGNPPGNDYFWLPGYWDYVAAKNDYQWLGGSWQKFNPNLILEAARWLWRPEGYLFVPTYWDWKLEARGLLYDCKTQQPLGIPAIINQLTPYYPDYICELAYYWHYTPDYWHGCSCVPPWWHWNDWWTLPWNNQWWLWWWWWNPGFPAPPFLPGGFIDFIPPPVIIIIDAFGPFPLPIFITPFGVPLFFDWLEALNQFLGGNNGLNPFLPLVNLDGIIQILDNILPETSRDRPRGTPDGAHHPKPTSPDTLTPPAGTEIGRAHV